MAVFNSIERREIMDYIVTVAEKNEHIMSLIVVGSGAYGYNDDLSDLDMVIAVDNGENLESVMDYINSQLSKKINFMYFKQVLPIRLQVYMSEKYLEIDIGYGAYTYAAATQKSWKVVFDKTGTVEEAMKRSWSEHQNASKTDEYTKKAAECADRAWHNLMHTAVAIKRKRYWRAVAELESARNLYIEMLGFKYSIDVCKNKDVDKLPKEDLEVLQKSLVTSLTEIELWANLKVLTDALYTEIEQFRDIVNIKVDRQHVNEFIDFCK